MKCADAQPSATRLAILRLGNVGGQSRLQPSPCTEHPPGSHATGHSRCAHGDRKTGSKQLKLLSNTSTYSEGTDPWTGHACGLVWTHCWTDVITPVTLRAQASRRAAVRLRASQTRLPRSTQKRRRRTQRRRRRSEKRACSDTIEESSSADEVDARRKRARDCKESPSRPLMYIQSDTSLLLHITTVRTHGRCSCDMWYHERTSVHFTVARSVRLKSGVSHDLCQSSPALAPLSDFAHGCAGVRFGEARNPGPATHDRDRTAEQRNARHRRINEAGDSVPGSQDSLVCRSTTCSWEIHPKN